MTEYVPKTPPYTAEQKAIVIPKDSETPTQQLQRRIATITIDTERYRQAAKDHPDMARHYETLIERAEGSIPGWEAHAADQGVIPVVVSDEALWMGAMAEARHMDPAAAYKYQD